MAQKEISKVKNLYNNCMNNALQRFRDQGYNIHPKYVDFEATKDDKKNITVKAKDVLHFKSLPWRGKSSKNKKIDILASVEETISPGPPRLCVYSNVKVTYFMIDEKTGVAHAIESIRYDALVPPKKKHPICHAHSTPKPLSGAESFRYKINSNNIKNRYKDVHIPTAYINLVGLLLVLAADHFTDNQWYEFRNNCSEYFKKLPFLANCSTINNIMREKSLMAYHWYES